MTHMLTISNLHARTTDGKEILHGITLTVRKGEIHAIMGPNGGGKSTLAQVLMGHPGYIITQGSITVNNVDITSFSPDKRSKQGLFLGFQYPVEVNGVHFSQFLRMALNQYQMSNIKYQINNKNISPIAFRKILQEQAKKLAITEDITKRFLNEGFSGGEKKKAEILQMAVLKPDFAILDEPDSGLDVDALKYIAKTITTLDYPFGLILITHYQRILHYIKPDYVHILVGGKIVKSGNSSLALEVEEKGYKSYIKNEMEK